MENSLLGRLVKLPERKVTGWRPKAHRGKYLYAQLPPLTDARLNRAIYLWTPTQQWYVVDYWHGLKLPAVRRAVYDLLDLGWPSTTVKLTPIDPVAMSTGILHHSIPAGWTLALQGTVPRQLVHCE